ncbi:class II fructose-bisphosphate aldolase [Agromyces mangrovi Wang et al. 2018]|uniref:class II fructose-bisphosphate aldolase n=1 Tax=Agromyces mangrovi TaxID=1858653 RepID=UPI002572677F|nr:class II fructose-bisphosphate aldolase [Agromyces mangrovi]BDZ65200.1 fructose-bisphosphate aldolase [Agromyces mangrovi]
MPLTPTLDILHAARSAGAGVGAFNVVLLETAEALVRAAECTRMPIVLQISENCVAYHGGLRPVARATLALADAATVPVAVHLDHAELPDLAFEAIDLGFGSVMYDGSRLAVDENIATTQRVVAHAHAAGVAVEAELGEIGGKDGAHAPHVRTDPIEAACFVDATGVDALAVAVGSSHAMTARTAALDVDLIARIRAAVDVPLVLHGSSGVPDDTIVAGIRAGLVKINVSTHLNSAFTSVVREMLDSDETTVDPRRYIGRARSAVADEAARMLRVFRAAGATLEGAVGA